MKKLLLVSFLSLALAMGVIADVNKTKTALQTGAEDIKAAGAGAGTCSIIYYNLCSGWIWIYSGFAAGDEVGVIFDLVADCGKLPGETCCMTHGFWYWRFTSPTYGFTVSYGLFEVDANGCKTAQTGGLAFSDPAERWNLLPGLGCVTGDQAVICATFDAGTLPYMGTDNNQSNAAGGPNCLGIGAGTGNSVFYGNPGATQYCPPQYFGDAIGPVDIMMDAGWICGTNATEDASWGDVKSLFR